MNYWYGIYLEQAHNSKLTNYVACSSEKESRGNSIDVMVVIMIARNFIEPSRLSLKVIKKPSPCRNNLEEPPFYILLSNLSELCWIALKNDGFELDEWGEKL